MSSGGRTTRQLNALTVALEKTQVNQINTGQMYVTETNANIKS